MVGPRRRSREVALQILHQIDVGGDPHLEPGQMISRYFAHLASENAPVSDDDQHGDVATLVDRKLVDELVRGVSDHRAEIDARLTVLSRNLCISALLVTVPWPGTTFVKSSCSAESSVDVHSFALPPPG